MRINCQYGILTEQEISCDDTKRDNDSYDNYFPC